uniref:Cingulin n=1 Tax=Stegastes partitus TaxID=144197 RepID=A0A3B5B2B0_9TELE
MSAPSSGRKTPVDHGVQIRFINDLHDTGGGQPGSQPKKKIHNKYGVAVRVQGIAGQPYVVLKDGQKGDSYGVQLRTHYPSGFNSLPRSRDKPEPGTEGADVGGGGQAGALRRAQSHGSLLDRDGNEDFQLSRPPGDGKSGSYGNLDAGIGVRGDREQSWPARSRDGSMERNMWDGSYQTGLDRSFSDLCLKVTPDLLLDQGHSAEMSSEDEEQLTQMIYNILRQGEDTQSTHTVRQKTAGRDVVPLSVGQFGETGSYCGLFTRQTSSSKNHSLSSCPRRLTQLRMDRENAETRVRTMEDQLAELQDELRRENGNKTVRVILDLMSCQTQLMEVCQLKQKLEETLRQRERELTALKGALKEEVASHDKEIEALREQYSVDMEKLRGSMEQVSQSHAGIEAERLRVNASVRTLQQQLEDCRDESSHWMEQFHTTRDELRTQTVSVQELQRCNADLQKTRSDLEKQRTEYDKKIMEVISIKKSHQDQEAELKYEIDRLKDQLQRAKDDFSKAQEKNKRVDLNSLQDAQQEQEEANARLKEKLSRLEVTFHPPHSEAELALHAEVRGLRSELDEAKRKASRANQEQRELSRRLEESEKDKDTLKQTVSQLEETKRQQERSLEKLTKECDSLNASSREETQVLRVQLEEQRERARKEMQEAQRHGNDAQSELERTNISLRRLEEEMSRQKKELLLVCEERDNHQLDKELLTNRLRHLEGEVETGKNSLNEKSREVRILEDKLKRLELELEEEKSSAEMMTDRVARSRDQIDQLRSELMQERSSKQDLELDKNAMERHLKELRSRVADMEGQSRSSAGVSQLENKVQELEDRLRAEDREKSTMLASQRRLERKLKDLNMTLDEERHTHSEQRDQLSLRVKALKRQVDEGETELERIDGLRRKAQRDMEEQMELKEALQARVSALETELKRKAQAAMRPALDSSALSSDDDDNDSLYDSSAITSILTESNLQTSSC